MARLAVMGVYNSEDGKTYELFGDISNAETTYKFFKIVPAGGDGEYGMWLLDPDDQSLLDAKSVEESTILKFSGEESIEELIADGEEIYLEGV